MCGQPPSSDFVKRETVSKAIKNGVKTVNVENKSLQLVEDSGFPCIIKSNDDHFVLCRTNTTYNTFHWYSLKEQ